MAGADLEGRNRRFYDTLWADTGLVAPERFNTWPLISMLAERAPRRLEVGAGLRPRLPIRGSCFVDLSPRALEALRARGGAAMHADARALPVRDAEFDLVCAFDVIEHVEDDGPVFRELARVLAPDGVLVLSTPLHAARWTAFDEIVGHWRRYEPPALAAALADHGFAIERSAAYGMQPRSQLLSRLGAWWLRNHRAHAMWWYNRVFMPLGLRFEGALAVSDGLIPTERVDEILIVCRRVDVGTRPVELNGAASGNGVSR